MDSIESMLPSDGPFKALEGNSFHFACHPGVPCFNKCCADLSLVLTPYDILRLKNHLNLKSDEFLEKYTESRTGKEDRFPKVYLQMTSTEGRPCPFVRPEGCSVYPDRPGACRTYPLGRGSARGGKEMFFLVQEDHCRGFERDTLWEVEEWLSDQGLNKYNHFNDVWMEIITAPKSLGPEEHRVRKVQMFYMVSYNLDRFKAFLFESRFLKMFDLEPARIESAHSDDEILLDIGFDWLKFALYGEKTIPMKVGG